MGKFNNIDIWDTFLSLYKSSCKMGNGLQTLNKIVNMLCGENIFTEEQDLNVIIEKKPKLDVSYEDLWNGVKE